MLQAEEGMSIKVRLREWEFGTSGYMRVDAGRGQDLLRMAITTQTGADNDRTRAHE